MFKEPYVLANLTAPRDFCSLVQTATLNGIYQVSRPVKHITSTTTIIIAITMTLTLRPTHNGRHFADDIFKCIFLNENASIAIKISLKFVPKGPINNTPSFVQIMASRHPGDKPLSEPMMVSLPTHICVTRPQ